MTPYRIPDPPPPVGVIELPPFGEHQGPRFRCPICGASDNRPSLERDRVRVVENVRACTGASWWRRVFLGGCRRRVVHLHQKCVSCGGSWVCSAVGDDEP